ncbi:hypothetical protein HN481_04020 [Candidatus Parcubacteria bacterium]|mgnify:CR=1 FL=1|jgi:hypothetical protein|nr:hypothetical protein [Candidatus Parcubacteria bacterium]
MISNIHKNLAVSVIVFSLLFCCGAAWHTMLVGSDSPMESHAACGMGDVGSQADSGHTYSVVSSIFSLFKNITISLSVVFISVAMLSLLLYDRFLFYYKKSRDRYGGFQLFVYFINLFRLGILNPKTF